MKFFIETNIFLRFLTRDEEKQFQACKKLFEKAKRGKIELITSALVIFEIIWTLLSYYHERKESIIEKILSLLEFPSLEVEHKDIFIESLVIWQEKNIDFNDAFNYAWAKKKKAEAIYSFDKHFDRLPNLKRIIP